MVIPASTHPRNVLMLSSNPSFTSMEIQFIREGRGLWTVNGKTFEGGAGDIFVIKAGEIHSFKALGDSPLMQVDVHLSPRFIQENL
jgi:quercetin dioxygenase-like cupin family protein